MTALGHWRTSLVVHGYDPDRDESVPVRVGSVDTVAGGTQVAMVTGDGPVLILTVQDANGLSGHLSETVEARLRLAAERLGGRGAVSPGETLAVGFGLACIAVLLIMGVVAWWRDMHGASRGWRRLVAELRGSRPARSWCRWWRP
jgi:hypothetical protein